MKELNEHEIDAVSGTGLDQTDWATGATIGLMALAPASILVITTGMVALSFYTMRKYYETK